MKPVLYLMFKHTFYLPFDRFFLFAFRRAGQMSRARQTAAPIIPEPVLPCRLAAHRTDSLIWFFKISVVIILIQRIVVSESVRLFKMN